jgi:hypothetical protein
MKSLRIVVGLMALALLSLAFFKPAVATVAPPIVQLVAAEAVADPATERQAKLLAAASTTGALLYCREKMNYQTVTPELSFARLRTIFQAEAEENPAFAQFSYQVFMASRQLGAALTLAPRGAVPLGTDGKPRFHERDMDVNGECEEAEAMLRNMMEKGGVLDVAPAGGKDA